MGQKDVVRAGGGADANLRCVRRVGAAPLVVPVKSAASYRLGDEDFAAGLAGLERRRGVSRHHPVCGWPASLGAARAGRRRGGRDNSITAVLA